MDIRNLHAVALRLEEVVVDPAAWPRILEDISAAAGAYGAMLLQSDIRTADIPHTSSLDEGLRQYFGEKWHQRDIRAARGVPKLMNGAVVVSDSDILTPEEISRSPLYNEALLPNKTPWFAVIGFTAGSALWGLSLQRTEELGAFSETEKSALRFLSRRLTEAASLSTLVGRVALSSVANALASVGRRPVAVMDRLGRIIHWNEEADRFIGKDLSLKGGRLYVPDRKAMAQIERLCDRLMLIGERDTLYEQPIVVRRPDKAPLVLTVMPVDATLRDPFLGARVLLVINDLDERYVPDIARAQVIFNLTPAEARIAGMVASGMELGTIAEKIGIARETARNQLKAVFAKTGTHRQGELVALLARLAE